MDTPQPALPTLEAAAAIAAEYASKYASKPDNIDVNTNATLLATELIAAREANVGAPPASLKWTRNYLMQALNQVHGSVAYPASLCSF